MTESPPWLAVCFFAKGPVWNKRELNPGAWTASFQITPCICGSRTYLPIEHGSRRESEKGDSSMFRSPQEWSSWFPVDFCRRIVSPRSLSRHCPRRSADPDSPPPPPPRERVPGNGLTAKALKKNRKGGDQVRARLRPLRQKVRLGKETAPFPHRSLRWDLASQGREVQNMC